MSNQSVTSQTEKWPCSLCHKNMNPIKVRAVTNQFVFSIMGRRQVELKELELKIAHMTSDVAQTNYGKMILGMVTIPKHLRKYHNFWHSHYI